MTQAMKTDHPAYRSAIGVALAAALVLLLPLLAMQITDEVAWDLADFAVAWTLLVGAGLTYKLVARGMGNIAYRAAVGVAVATALLLVWVNLAVGVIGNEGDPANLMYGGVIAVGIIGALLARFQPRGMARALFASALAQALVAVIALSAGLGSPVSRPLEILVANGLFAALWGGSAWLFWSAARTQPPAGAEPQG
ncbi:MAG: hypothetical protein OEY20_06325 [Gemmatimonadota bacterium]|nr:hypothetical protein [Gemmatimonadota bacterium]MDH5196849.1 hypothetical protein [Gemmatimonadota bacterium]